jgi:hypothetical protein
MALPPWLFRPAASKGKQSQLAIETEAFDKKPNGLCPETNHLRREVTA